MRGRGRSLRGSRGSGRSLHNIFVIFGGLIFGLMADSVKARVCLPFEFSSSHVLRCSIRPRIDGYATQSRYTTATPENSCIRVPMNDIVSQEKRQPLLPVFAVILSLTSVQFIRMLEHRYFRGQSRLVRYVERTV